MKTNSQTRTYLRINAFQSTNNNGGKGFQTDAYLVLQVLEDFTELYHEKNALLKENKKLLKRLERIKWITDT